MSNVDGSLGSLVQGVSQQPYRARLPGQAEAQINCVNDEVFGLSRRPSMELKSVSPEMLTQYTIETGNIFWNGTNLTYIMRTGTNPKIQINDLAAREVVLLGSAGTYLDTGFEDEYQNKVLFREMDGKVFVTNTQKVVEKLTTTPASNRFTNEYTCVIYCKGGQYGTGYTVTVSSGSTTHSFTYCTPDGTQAEHTEKGQVKYIVAQLYHLLTTVRDGTSAVGSRDNPDYPVAADDWTPEPETYYSTDGGPAWISANFDVRMVGEHIILTRKTETAFTATGSDGGRGLMVSVHETVSDVGDLPLRAPHGKTVRVTGSTRAEDDYFLAFGVPDGTLGEITDEEGIWQEVTDPSQPNQLDPATMPHILSFNGNLDRWEIAPAEWEPRLAGDDLTNPFPEFVGSKIQDLVSFQGRMTVLHDADVSAGTTNDVTNWFKKSATGTVDTDPIHIRSTSATTGSKNIYAVPFNRDLIIFTNNNEQFAISGRSAFVPSTASIVNAANFDMDPKCRPQVLGDRLVFTSYTGKFTHVHEMFLSGDFEQHARRTITDHVPRYIEGQGRMIEMDDGSNFGAVLAEDRRTIYAYEFLWQDDSRVQSAWSRWIAPADVYGLIVRDGILRVVMKAPNAAFSVQQVRLYRENTSGLDFHVHLDTQQRRDLSGLTTFSVNVMSGDLSKIAVVDVDGPVPGALIPIESIAFNTTPDTDQPDRATVVLSRPAVGEVVVGERYDWEFEPTMPVVKDRDGVAQSQKKLTVSNFHITFGPSGPFTMTRRSLYENTDENWEMRYSGRVLGDPDTILGTMPIDEGTVTFPFSDLSTASSLVLSTDTHLPVQLTEIEWNGSIRNRRRRVTSGG